MRERTERAIQQSKKLKPAVKDTNHTDMSFPSNNMQYFVTNIFVESVLYIYSVPFKSNFSNLQYFFVKLVVT